MDKYSKVYILELNNVDRNKDIMKASDLCQNKLIFVGDTNWDYYYSGFSEKDIEKLNKMGADLEEINNIAIISFEDKQEFLNYCNNNEILDTETILQSGFPPKDHFNIMIKAEKC